MKYQSGTKHQASVFDEDVYSKITTSTKICMFLLGLAKLSGFAAVGLAFAGMMTFGYICLSLAGLSLITIFVLCGLEFRKQSKEYQDNKTAIQKMEHSGTLAEQLRSAGYRIQKIKVER